MAPPSKLIVATSAVQRLVKEEASYHKELEQQAARIKKYQDDKSDENAEYILKQETQAIQETKKIFPELQEKIKDAVAKLEEQLEANKEAGGEVSTEEVTKAKEAVADAKKAIRETA